MNNKNSFAVILLFLLTSVLIIFIFCLGDESNYKSEYAAKIDTIMDDELEIEKKFLIDKNNIPYDLEKAEILEIEQTYVNFSPEIRVRKINRGEDYTFAVKTNITQDGMTRNEFEDSITEYEYKELIEKKEGNTIYKTRYQFLDDDYLIAIDIFSGDLEGLAYMEIEFENHEIANQYRAPDWVIKDVTHDLNYKNGHLARYGIPESYYKYIEN